MNLALQGKCVSHLEMEPALVSFCDKTANTLIRGSLGEERVYLILYFQIMVRHQGKLG